MAVVVVGPNHRTAPVGILERLSISDEALPKALHQLATYEHVLEGVILSTCNRTEVYAAVTRFHGGAQDLRNFLAEFCHLAPEEFNDHLYTYYEEGAVRHLFRVAAGMDSMVVGESEILGQVRRAFQIATAEHSVHRALGHAFRRALRVGKRARTETSISRNPASVSSAAVELARRAFPDRSLAGKRVVVVGAGKMGRLAMRALARAGATDVTLVNRSLQRAHEAGAAFGAATRPLDELGAALADADIVLSSTTAPGIVIDRATVDRAVAGRRAGAPLLLVDVAVPRDVDRGVARIPGVVVRDIDDLRGVVETTLGSRLSETTRVEAIVAEELARFLEWMHAAEIGPTVAALVERAEGIRTAEMQRVRARLEGLTGEQRAAIDGMTKRMIAKLLHSPIEKAKQLTGKQGHVYLGALRELVDLDEEL
jgi:glutamyl-tRNA reductase